MPARSGARRGNAVVAAAGARRGAEREADPIGVGTLLILANRSSLASLIPIGPGSSEQLLVRDELLFLAGLGEQLLKLCAWQGGDALGSDGCIPVEPNFLDIGPKRCRTVRH